MVTQGATFGTARVEDATMSEKATVTVDEAARRLGLGRNATYEAVRNGEVPAIRIGRRWLVPSAALDRLLNDPPHNKAR